jgi:hypothetical protein
LLYPDLIDIPIEQFGGYNPALPPSDLPPGASPLCQDVVFPEGAVTTRGGLINFFGATSPVPATASINGLKSYLTPTLAQRLMAWDSLGNLYKESPQGTLTIVGTRPYQNLLYQSMTLFGREYQTFFNAAGGFDIPRQYDDQYWDRVSQVGPGASPAAVDSATAGNIVAGKHQVSVCFITRQSYITMPSVPPTTWTAAGNKQVALTAIATGPPNIIARLLIFTPVITPPATTGTFYSTPNGTTQLATQTAMLIPDNVTTAYTVDFLDAILIVSFQAEYLFTQIELGECQFAAGYNSRTVWLGERAKQANFVNLTFDGGWSSPSAPNTTAFVAPGTVADISGSAPWTAPNNIKALDGVFSTCVLGSLINSFSDILSATNFGFAIPGNATILGISVKVYVACSPTSSYVRDYTAQLMKAGVLVGVNRANGNLWQTVVTLQSYGSATDLWGTTWLPADINNANFGFAYQAQSLTNSSPTAKVDYVAIAVAYSTPLAAKNPLGWTLGASYAGGDSALNAGLTGDWQDAFAITGDGATAVRGQITQTAFEDYLLTPIISRNTSYRVRARIASANGLIAGTIHVNLQSTSGAFTTLGLAVPAAALTASYQEFDALLTTAPLQAPPTDLVLQVYADGTPTNGGTFLIDSIEPYVANIPFNYSTARLSHASNPESFDSVTGAIQVRPNDGTQLRVGFPLRGNYYLAKDHYLCYVTDDGVNEPAQWGGGVQEVSATIGICGPNAVDWTEEWAVFAERSGVYIIWGGDPVKISQEIQEDASRTGKITWSSVNWNYGYLIDVRIDTKNKRILVNAPINGPLIMQAGGIQVPSVIFVMDYKWLDGPADIAASAMVTYSAFTGKILSHGRGRRWTYWNISAASMCFAERSDGTSQPFFGSSTYNGLIYQQGLEGVQLSDNGAAINSVYQTYYSPSHMEEQAFRMSAHRKLLGYLKWRAIGAGSLLLSVQAGSRVTNLRNYTLSMNPFGDGERGLNLHGERFSFSISTNAVGAWFQLEKFVPCLRKDAVIVVRGANV